MRKIKWEVSIGLVGCRRSGEILVEDDASEEEIDEAVNDEMWNILNLHWREE